MLNHTNVGVALHAVAVGAVTVQLVFCVAPLYTAGNEHVKLLVLLNVDPFAFRFAVNVTAALLLCAYAIVSLLLAFNVILQALLHTQFVCVQASLLNQIGVNPLGAVIVGHVVLQLCVGAVPLYADKFLAVS